MPSKKNSIALQEYVRAGTINVGQTIRLNHKRCPAGEDTRQRLYITRPEEGNGLYLGFCHNCGNSGVLDRYSHTKYWRDSLLDTSGFGFSSTLPAKVQEVQGLLSYTEALDTVFHVKGTGTFKYYNVAETDLLHFSDLKFNPTTNRWHLPVADNSSVEYFASTGKMQWHYTNIEGYNERAIFDKQAPRYKLTVNKNFRGYTNYYNKGAVFDHQTRVLVEDQMSAINIARAAILNGGPLDAHIGVCLYGCANSIEKIHSLHNDAPDSTKWVIWFDNDKTIVKEKAEQTAKYLNLLGTPKENIRVFTTENSEPKKVELASLQSALMSMV